MEVINKSEKIKSKLMWYLKAKKIVPESLFNASEFIFPNLKL